MCGIAGIYYFEKKPSHASQTVKAMAGAIAHRGMDDKGLFESNRLALAHQRLSIIDLETGHQPMSNEDGSVVVACNGEIYNYRELGADLKARGHFFSTSSDTEVLVHLYEDIGLEMFDRLNGIFAFALWDDRKKRLILARDHFGVKPMHICQDKSQVLFASEVKAILAGRQVSPNINMQAFHYFMNLRYVPGRHTLFKGIERLMPGEYAVIDQQGLRRRSYRERLRLGDGPVSEASAIDGIRHHLNTAVSRQLVADVPLGIYLSGGMDSSSILAAARQDTPDGPISTFTLGFNEPTDEVAHAERVATYFGTQHHAWSVEPEPLQHLPEVLWYVEEPKINMLQGFLLAQHVKPLIKVALAGLGGDELFAGYLAYQYMKPSELFHRWMPDCLVRNILQPLSGHLLHVRQHFHSLRLDEYQRAGHMLLSIGDKCRYYAIIRNVWDYDARLWRQIYGPRVLEHDLALSETVFEPYFADRRRPFVEQAMEAEFQTKMVDDFLLNEDRVSMAHGLEVRVPFLDRDLVSFAARLPDHQKMRGLRTKYIFKKAMAGVLPDFVLAKKKWGFAFNPYFQFKKDLEETARQVLTPERVKALGLFNYEFVRRVLRCRPHPRLRWHYFTLWMMVGFHIWHDMFMGDTFVKPTFELEAYKT